MLPLIFPNTGRMMWARLPAGKPGLPIGKLKTPLIVDDTGFSIDALNGFPGPYAAYVLNTIGNTGILKLMEGVTDRRARFTTAIAYADEQGIQVFTGTIEGRITTSPRGSGGFGYDPIFEVGTTDPCRDSPGGEEQDLPPCKGTRCIP